MVVLRQVSVDRSAWTDPVRQRGASPEERQGDLGRVLGQDARGIVQVVPLVADLQASVHSKLRLRELKKPLPDASHRVQTVVPEPFLQWMAVGLEEQQSVARLVTPKAQQAEQLLGLPWCLAKWAGEPARTESPQAERCQSRAMFLQARTVALGEHAHLAREQVQRASQVPRRAERAWTLRLFSPPPPLLLRPQSRENVFGPARRARDRANLSASFSPSRRSGEESRSRPWP